MSMSADITEWLRTSPRIAWETDFSYMLNSSTEHAALKNFDGLSLFIQALNAEFKEANHDKAFSYYRQAAKKLDPLSLCRLHEIYMGDAFFKTQMDVDKAIIYLIFAGLYSQDVDFADSIVPFKKLKAFLGVFDPECQLALEIFQRVNDHSINAVKDLTYCLLLDFQEIDQKKQRNDFLSIVESLPIHVQKDVLYTIYLNEFRLPWAHAVHKKENLVLKFMQNAEIFESFFESYKGLVSLATINRTIVVKFKTWLQTVLFVIDFAALSPAKKAYYHTLMLFISQALEKNIFDNKDTQCWLRYFLAYCYEKGIEGEKNPQKALELIKKNIMESPEGIKYPLRQALLLKKIGNESRVAIERFEELYSLRAKQFENSLLCYTRAKSFEKYYDDIERAVRYYTQGAAELGAETSQQTYFFYSYWRIKCLKKLEKLNQKASGAVRTTITGILSKMKTNVEPQKTAAPLQKEILDEHHKTSLFLESKSVLGELGIRVFSDKQVKPSKDQAPNTLVVGKTSYYTEKFEIDNADILRRHSEPLQRLFSERNQKLVPAEGIYLKEKGDILTMFFLTPEFALDLHQVIHSDMFYDIKTKVHVASQIALCIGQIHKSNQGAYYGTLKPKKILLDQYFSVKLHDSCIKMQRYQVMESDVYLAPEQFQGMDGPASDIWALGRILWELLCEHKVEESQLKEGEKESLEGIEELVQRMTHNDAEKRVAIKEVYEVLREIYNKIPRI